MSNTELPIKNWIMVPAIITLVVTVLRAAGESLQWNETLFGSPSNPAAVVGITWLIPIFGIYFGYKLAAAGHRPNSLGKAALWLLAAFAVFVALAAAMFFLVSSTPSLLGGLGLAVVTALVLWIAFKGWRDMACVLTAYAYAARIPVAIIILLAIYGDWGTHYEAMVEGYEQPNLFLRWLETGLFPQLTANVVITVVFGGLFACLGALFAPKQSPSSPDEVAP
ncbi:MAG TPA: hypothetical protein VLV83_25315 [Acidobacteriota bacterium]|nr:hypothetical protein [Acidobacteriota bacterium]